MGWAFYELSGGSDFVPEQRVVAEAEETVEEAPVVVATAPAAEESPVILASVTEETSVATDEPAPFAEAAQALDQDMIDSVIASMSDDLPVEAGVVEEVVAAVEDAVDEDAALQDVRYVTVRSLNVRSGPSTSFGVVGKLAFGEATLVLSDAESGWVEIRIEGDGVVGYTASRFLSDDEPNG